MLSPPSAPNGFQPALQQDAKEELLEQRRDDDGRHDGDRLLAGSAGRAAIVPPDGPIQAFDRPPVARHSGPIHAWTVSVARTGRNKPIRKRNSTSCACQGTGRRRAKGMTGFPCRQRA